MSNNDRTNDDNINEQPTAMAPAGSHEEATGSQNTWQTGAPGDRQADQEDAPTQRADAPGAAQSMSQNDASRPQSAPGQYPPVPGSTPPAQQGQSYGSQSNQGQTQWNSQPSGQQYGSYGQNAPQASYPSSPHGQGYGSNGAPGYGSGAAQTGGYPSDQQSEGYGSQSNQGPQQWSPQPSGQQYGSHGQNAQQASYPSGAQGYGSTDPQNQGYGSNAAQVYGSGGGQAASTGGYPSSSQSPQSQAAGSSSSGHGFPSSAQNQGYGSAAPQGQSTPSASGYASAQGSNPQGQTYGSQQNHSQPYQTPSPVHSFAGTNQGGNSANQAGNFSNNGYTGNNGHTGNGQPFGQQHSASPFGTDTQTKPAPGLGRKVAWGIVASALLAIIGCFGTWMWIKINGGILGTFEFSTNGLGNTSSNIPESGAGDTTEDSAKDGWLVLIPALIVLGIGVMRALGKLKKQFAWGAVGLSVIAAGVALYDFFDVKSDLKDLQASSEASAANFSAGSGWGLTLCVIAALAMLVTSVISALRD